MAFSSEEKDFDFKAGDYVRFRLALRELEGVVLENHEKGVVLVKLASGYNIGIPKENIHGFEVLKRHKEEGKSGFSFPHKKGKPSIGMVVTGGTIASKLDYKTGGVKPLTGIDEFARFYPKLFEKVNVKEIKSPFMLDSSCMSSFEWMEIAKAVKNLLDDKEIEGVIVTHGTDSLHYTAAALSFFLKNLSKPVVLTYSQRSIDRASSDAELNLQCAAEFALSECAEVVIVGHGSMNDDYCLVMRGTKVRKLHSSRRDAFKSVNAKPIAKITLEKGIEFLGSYNARSKKKIELDAVFNDKVVLVKFYPGQKPDVLDFYLDKGYKGVVIEVLGLGQIAVSGAKHNWIPKIKKLIKKGVFVCAAAQTIYGGLNPNVYSVGRELKEAGVVFLEDMLSETAFVKLGWVLGHKNWRSHEKIKEKMLGNFEGEFSKALTE